jgi:hypothetical protein
MAHRCSTAEGNYDPITELGGERGTASGVFSDGYLAGQRRHRS